MHRKKRGAAAVTTIILVFAILIASTAVYITACTRNQPEPEPSSSMAEPEPESLPEPEPEPESEPESSSSASVIPPPSSSSSSAAPKPSASSSAQTTAGSMTYSKAGEYDQKQTLSSASITADKVTLSNKTITGDLTITKGVGNGHVTLEKVVVKGKLKVAGGGSNSIELIDCTIGEIQLYKSEGEPVRFVASGSTEVGAVVAKSGIILEEDDLDSGAKGFVKLTTEPSDYVYIITQLDSTDLDLFVANATSRVDVDGRSDINRATVNARSSFEGSGSIGTMTVTVSGVTTSIRPGKVNAASGVSEPTYTSDDDDSRPTRVAPTITTDKTLPGGTVGQPYSYTLNANGTKPITWSLYSGSLPPGLSLSSTGVLSGTPTTAADFSFTVKATNSAGSDTKNLSILIAPTVTSVTIKNQPTKVAYYDGQSLDLSGLVVTLQKSNGTSEDVAFTDFDSKGITTSPANGATLTTANNKVTITHTASGKKVEQTITVSSVTITGISVKTAPTKTVYIQGEALNLSGLVVTLIKSNSTSEDVAFADFTSKGITTSPANGAALSTTDTKVTITAGDKSVEQPITVSPVTVTNISVKYGPNKTNYFEGDVLDLTGLVVTLEKSNSTSEDVAFADFASKSIATIPANGAVLSTTNNKVTITAGGKSVEQTISVSPVTVTGISIKTAPTQTDYYEGQSLNLSGLVVTLQKSNGTSEDVAFASFGSKSITTSPADGAMLSTSNDKVTITAGGKSVEQPITVSPVTVTGISVKTQPSKTDFYDGQVLDLSGLVITLEKSNGTSEDVALANFASKGITTSPANGAALSATVSKVTITHTASTKAVDQPIKVKSVTLEIQTPPTKINYTEGDKLDLYGLVVTVTTMVNGTTTETLNVPFTEFASKGITVTPAHDTTLTKDDSVLTIKHNESNKSVTQAITVTSTDTSASKTFLKNIFKGFKK